MRMKWLENPGCWVFSDGKIAIPAETGVRFLKHSINSLGYAVVTINKKTVYAHRLIASAYIPNPLNKPVIDHIDRNRSNNRIDNLRWVTQRENLSNTEKVDNALKRYGIRCCDDRVAYKRAKYLIDKDKILEQNRESRKRRLARQ